MHYVVPETELNTDDTETIADLLKCQWSLGAGMEPTIQNKPESMMVNARIGSIYVYLINRNTQPSSVDYNTLQRRTYIGIKISCRTRDFWRAWHEEVLRIIMSNRRAGKHPLGGYTFMELTNERFANDLSGWYTSTVEIRLTSFNTPLRTAGMGDCINRHVECIRQDPDADCDNLFESAPDSETI